ncbi:MAG: hypothetical protein COA58_05985 [Bacteroidetes bacterium]|nr:MAG: hypothetical protein COA58_05985 [Bacteroidota bacterium]
MKRTLRIFGSLICFIITSMALAQVSTYPFVEDFESPSIWQTTPASCDATTNGAGFSGWTQDASDNGDWRADSAGTGSLGTGPGSGRLISGSGSGTDANPGTIGGTYIYTEATNATSCGGAEINMLSPFFDFSASGKYYQLKFNYHMLGSGMGSLNIDIRNGLTGVWTNSVWSQVGEKDSAWILDSVNLANYNSDSIQIRIRGVMGTNYQSDMAFDNFQIDTFAPNLADAILLNATINDLEYPIAPLLQFDSLLFSASVKNEGLNKITNAEVNITSSGYSSIIDLDSIQPFVEETDTTTDKFGTNTTGLKEFYFQVTISETESLTTNNFDTLSVTISDSTLAREDLTSTTNGIGFNTGVGEIGQMFELINADTVTSVTFYSAGPTIGDSVRVVLRYFNQIPGAIIETSQSIQYVAGQNWYTVPLKCFTPLAVGEYFVAIEQLTNSSNMSLGYTDQYATDSTSFFGGAAGWTALESVGFPISELLRLNFGHYDTYREVNISTNKDTVCPGEFVYLQADKGKSFSWSPASSAFTPTEQNSLFDLSENTMIKIVADFGCNLTASDSVLIVVKKSPTGTITPDTTVCLGQSITLQASGGSSYSWIDGPTDTDWSVTPASTTLYNVLIDSSNGCVRSYNTTVTISEGNINVSNDTAACSGQTVSLSASGADTYQWIGGPATSNFNYTIDQTAYVIVTGLNSFGCSASDSVLVTSYQSPVLIPLNDTGACFTKNITVTAGGTADSFLWSNGDFTQSSTFQIFTSVTLSLIARNDNGCESYDTVEVARYLNPNGSIDADTTICEGETLKINAYGGASYEWGNNETTQEISVNPIEETTYTVIIRSVEGCEDFDNITVMVDPLPIAAFSYKDFKDSVAFTNESSLATSYSWDFGDGQTSTNENPYNIYKDSGDYVIVLTATNECGDVDSSISINVKVPKVVNGILEETALAEIQLYPVPTNGVITYTLENQLYGRLEIQVVDVTGKSILQKNIIKGSSVLEGNLDLTDYPAGVYLIQFKINNAQATHRVIKE